MITTSGFYTAAQIVDGIDPEMFDSKVFFLQERPDAGWYIGSVLGAQRYAVSQDATAELLGTVGNVLAGRILTEDGTYV
jgi:hypothetical protein